jgi:hypothetical protein
VYYVKCIAVSVTGFCKGGGLDLGINIVKDYLSQRGWAKLGDRFGDLMPPRCDLISDAF